MIKSYVVYVQQSFSSSDWKPSTSHDMIPLSEHEHFCFDGTVHKPHKTYEEAEIELGKYLDWISKKAFREDYTQCIHMSDVAFEIRTIYRTE